MRSIGSASDEQAMVRRRMQQPVRGAVISSVYFNGRCMLTLLNNYCAHARVWTGWQGMRTRVETRKEVLLLRCSRSLTDCISVLSVSRFPSSELQLAPSRTTPSIKRVNWK